MSETHMVNRHKELRIEVGKMVELSRCAVSIRDLREVTGVDDCLPMSHARVWSVSDLDRRPYTVASPSPDTDAPTNSAREHGTKEKRLDTARNRGDP